MPKIIQVNENSIFIGYENGNLKEVKRSDCDFVPQVGDLVEVFSSDTKDVVYKTGNSLNTAPNRASQTQPAYSHANAAPYAQQNMYANQYNGQYPQNIRQNPQGISPSQYGYAMPSYNQGLSLWGYFVDCITDKAFDFKGRARRKEVWAFILFAGLFSLSMQLLFVLLGATESVISVFVVVYNLIILIPSLSVYTRRAHDCNLSGWWLAPLILISFLAMIGAIVSIVTGPSL